MQTKQKTCKWCKTKFTPERPSKICCSPDCEYDYGLKHASRAEANRAREDRKTVKIKLQEMEPKSYWWKRAKKAFNAWVRARDEGKECISCDTILIKLGRVGGDYDAGHRRSVGSAKHLEFDERNVHGQCKYCNDRLAGNPDAYNAKLPSRIGQEAFDALMCDQEPRNLTANDYKAIEAHYVAKLKEIKNENSK